MELFDNAVFQQSYTNMVAAHGIIFRYGKKAVKFQNHPFNLEFIFCTLTYYHT